jgi:hypothetical protein
MRKLAGSLLLIAGAATQAQGYPQVEMNACIANATNSVYEKQLPATLADVKKYCHCALKKIIDQGRPIASSINYCNQRYILKR